MGYGKWGPWYSWLGLPDLAAALACVCRLHAAAGRPAALVSDESTLEACIRDNALYKLTIFTFTFFLVAKSTNLFCLQRQKEDVDWTGNSTHCTQVLSGHASQCSPSPVQLFVPRAWLNNTAPKKHANKVQIAKRSFRQKKKAWTYICVPATIL